MNCMRSTTMCYPVDWQKKMLLLGLKKRGFGKGWWNGFGGKPKENESLEDAAVRELLEEVCVKAEKNNLLKVAELSFYFPFVPQEKDWNQTVHTFFIEKWSGEPQETEEMKPQWFSFDSLPFHSMWADDPHWLPLVLDGKKLKVEFAFAEDNRSIVEKKINMVEGGFE